MTLKPEECLRTEVLVIGGGGAGLRAAIEARERGVRVLLVSQSRVGYGSNTVISGGAFAAVLSPSTGRQDPLDSPEQHMLDTVNGGCHVNDQSLVRTVADGAERQVEALRRFGVRFTDADAHPWISLSADPGHSRCRMVYGETLFGADFTFPLRRYAVDRGVEFLEGVLITRLLKDRGRVAGAMGVDAQGRVLAFAAPAVVLASGGLGQVYARTDNTGGSTGDGYVLAYDAGAALKDMEFVQFYPAALGRGTPALYYEYFLLEAGGKLLNRQGQDIVEKHGLAHPMLLTRDRLSQAVWKELDDGRGSQGEAVLDLSGIQPDRMEALRPVLPKAVLRGERRLPVAPTVHFHMGGVKINQRAETSVPGLYAAGEVCAGVHGANRLSGNALTEAWVFGAIAGRAAAGRAKESGAGTLPAHEVAAETQRLRCIGSGRRAEKAGALRSSLKDVMWGGAGVIRDAAGLQHALEEVAGLRERLRRLSAAEGQRPQLVLRLGNMLAVSEMICRAALYRSESRGAHCRRDCPGQNDIDWLRNVVIAGKDGKMSLSSEVVRLPAHN